MAPRMVYAVVVQVVAFQLWAAAAFDFGQAREQARALAQQPFQPRTNAIPSALLQLNYEQYQAIHFRPGAGLWAKEGLPFVVEYFLPGSPHRDGVKLNEVTSQGVRPILFEPEAFDFGSNAVALPPDLAYAGFRILHRARSVEEVASFIGASYYRMAGQGEVFGASARGLALNTTHLGQEEFPFFREFWLQKPAARAKSITLWALLDSATVTGAFEFRITPGLSTVSDTRACFFPRRAVEQFGVAPLTSMFLFDQNSHPPDGDFRPEVHDSDGLLMANGQGEVLWRPFDSGKAARMNAYHDVNPKGFGLMQRNRDFECYQDLVARYELRPSVWITPQGSWGSGAVQLLQLPTDVEYSDNVVAFWAPDTPPKAGESLELAYRTEWTMNRVDPPSLARVRATRIGKVGGSYAKGQPPNLRFVVDFDGAALREWSAGEKIEGEVHCGPGTKLVTHSVMRNEVNQTWRLVMEMTAPEKAVDLRARLRREGRPVSETWIYTWQP